MFWKHQNVLKTSKCFVKTSQTPRLPSEHSDILWYHSKYIFTLYKKKQCVTSIRNALFWQLRLNSAVVRCIHVCFSNLFCFIFGIYFKCPCYLLQITIYFSTSCRLCQLWSGHTRQTWILISLQLRKGLVCINK